MVTSLHRQPWLLDLYIKQAQWAELYNTLYSPNWLTTKMAGRLGVTACDRCIERVGDGLIAGPRPLLTVKSRLLAVGGGIYCIFLYNHSVI